MPNTASTGTRKRTIVSCGPKCTTLCLTTTSIGSVFIAKNIFRVQRVNRSRKPSKRRAHPDARCLSQTKIRLQCLKERRENNGLLRRSVIYSNFCSWLQRLAMPMRYASHRYEIDYAQALGGGEWFKFDLEMHQA